MTETRKIGGFSFFTLWFGASVSLAEIMTGSLIASLGLKQGLFVIFIGHPIDVLGMLLAMYFPMEQYENFLYMIGLLFAPVFSVVIANYFIQGQPFSRYVQFHRPSRGSGGVIICLYRTGPAYRSDHVLSMAVTLLAYAVSRYVKKAFVLKGEEKYAQ
ncbi:MAG: hypothetical protein PHY77_04430 [Desulfotomaculaceae bacterium]|nr:hypothetical protein [Desulfotomaculaceae bacterium]